jgi:hypothetical protein
MSQKRLINICCFSKPFITIKRLIIYFEKAFMSIHKYEMLWYYLGIMTLW